MFTWCDNHLAIPVQLHPQSISEVKDTIQIIGSKIVQKTYVWEKKNMVDDSYTITTNKCLQGWTFMSIQTNVYGPSRKSGTKEEGTILQMVTYYLLKEGRS